jgi:transcriptional activator SPT8
LFSASQDDGVTQPANLDNSKYSNPANTGQGIKSEGPKAEIGKMDANPSKLDPEPDAKSETSYDPLFDDDELEVENGQTHAPNSESTLSVPKVEGVTPATETTDLPAIQATTLSKKPTIPLLDSATYGEYSMDILLAASIDGQVVLWDRRAHNSRGVGRLEMGEKCPPWCLSVSRLRFRLMLPGLYNYNYCTGLLVV